VEVFLLAISDKVFWFISSCFYTTGTRKFQLSERQIVYNWTSVMQVSHYAYYRTDARSRRHNVRSRNLGLDVDVDI